MTQTLAEELFRSAISLLGQDGPEDGQHALQKLTLHMGCRNTPDSLRDLCQRTLNLYSGGHAKVFSLDEVRRGKGIVVGRSDGGSAA